ncbi:MAG: single-stranded DNA-binding protein [Eubacterium sp.]|nr:single-stranded DNA-binding protein [Eubacterium sp.]
MNKVVLMGRLTRDPDIRYSNSQSGEQLCIARFSLAVDRRMSRRDNNGNEQSADFINIVVFGKLAEHVEKYYKQGLKIALTGRIQTGSYVNKDGQKVYTTDVVAEELEFAESKNAAGSNFNGGNGGYSNFDSQGGGYAPKSSPDPSDANGAGFMNIEGDLEGALPFGQKKS